MGVGIIIRISAYKKNRRGVLFRQLVKISEGDCYCAGYIHDITQYTSRYIIIIYHSRGVIVEKPVAYFPSTDPMHTLLVHM